MNSLQSEDQNYLYNFDNPNSEDLHILEANEFLPHIGKWIHIGGGVMIGMFVVAISLSSVLYYNVTVKVPATIRPLGELRLVESAITGTVKKIAAKENQIVNKGEVIAYLDDSQFQSQKKQLQNTIQQSKLQLLQIDAQINEINTQIIAQTNLNERTILAARAELTGTKRNYQDQQIKTGTEMTQAKITINLAKNQLERLQKEKVLIASLQEAEAALKLAISQRDRLQNIVTSGAISQNLMEEKEQAVTSAQAKLEQAKSNARNLQEEKEQAVKLAQINLQKAKIGINPSNANVTVALERINQEKARGDGNLAALKKERELLIQQRLELQKQQIRTGQELQQLENELNKSVIRSPTKGTLMQLKLRNSGQVVQVSEALAQIAPVDAPLIIKAHVSAKDIDKIKIGQAVQMQVSSCPYPDYGTLKGTVKTIAPDVIATTQNNYIISTPQLATYEINIDPQNLFLGKGDRLCYLKSGMEGRADIISQQETVMQFILRKSKLITNYN
ncbi:HlyD family efflux transporter periplasmic adaptor subunit [Aphanizomenon flos-aquae NRERC-008]|uniref:HlyD family efflux transporter periplasmic adaptor subunit n=1 Tax=Aphanizomenon flos-aquae FACHB-1249 TaxID=2692889 RepID=A0ABR8IPR1_APHFL|nr:MULTISPECIES: HlyD family efflux transporter periplasmic adaptor subunit [Aphanizomenon]MBD2391737.1 HlyD family efflux transporter periplasmic adaptor subunit [Aphanizomenon flos-aquae FACHB-1171]MBD2557457.1 HlyD family efflux transporter periplasmic adaptor subunit [Aphanizomenon flos-aquae FACHB-1290]MBD2632349.1 HlyD family efflux transporter periplasmic adaptor subunit [Aphanizomenon sp. FACHB-1399]MBD2657158.1 HlyD family efflux transporter periplasmic adaptor subunit [Aphanizomenon f